jgi:hypothetical protein
MPMDVHELEAAAEELAARRNDPRTRAVVRRALLGCGRDARAPLTLRGYLVLQQHGSPLVTGGEAWAFDDAEVLSQQFCTAWAMVFPGRDLPPAGQFQSAVEQMAAQVARAFSTMMPMRSRGTQTLAEPDGLGWVARVLGRFANAGILPDAVLDLPMDVMWLTLAGMAAAEGKECAGQDYHEREIGDE